MQQNWDYLHIAAEEGRPRYVNDQEIPNWREGPVLFEAVDYLFRQGWELMDNPFAPVRRWLSYRPGMEHHFRRPRK